MKSLYSTREARADQRAAPEYQRNVIDPLEACTWDLGFFRV